MKLRYLSGLLMLLSLGACTETKQPTTTSNELTGSWAGTNETQQAGTCTWSGDASIRTTAKWQVVDKTVVGTVERTAGPTTVTARFNGTIDGNTVRVSEINQVVCNSVPSSYQSRYEGTISGNTLTLVSRDTLCPAQGCIFLRTLRLTRQ